MSGIVFDKTTVGDSESVTSTKSLRQLENHAPPRDSSTKPSLYESDFSRAFSKLLQKAGVTPYQIANYTELDEAYLSRLRSGERKNPSPQTITKISLALAFYSDSVTIWDIERLFRSVGRSLLVSK